MAYTYKGVTYLGEGEWEDNEYYDKYYGTYDIPTFYNLNPYGPNSYYLEAPRSVTSKSHGRNNVYIAKFPREVGEAMRNYFYVGPGTFPLIVDGLNIGTRKGHNVVFPKYRNLWRMPEEQKPVQDIVVYYTDDGLWDGYKVIALNNEIYGGQLLLVPDTGDYYKNVMLTWPYLDEDIRTNDYFRKYAEEHNMTWFDPYLWWRDYLGILGEYYTDDANSIDGEKKKVVNNNGLQAWDMTSPIVLDDVVVVGRPSTKKTSPLAPNQDNQDNRSITRVDERPTSPPVLLAQEQPESTLRLVRNEDLAGILGRIIDPNPSIILNKDISVNVGRNVTPKQPNELKNTQLYLADFHDAVKKGKATKADKNSERVRSQLDELHKAIRLGRFTRSTLS